MTLPLPASTGADAGLLVVTGATGWVGRSALAALHQLLGPEAFLSRVRAFASRAGSLSSSPALGAPAVQVPVHPLDTLPQLAASATIRAILHSAFLTRDRLASIGVERYVAINRGITDRVRQAQIQAPAARTVVISSGAVAAPAACPEPEDLLSDDPYGVLKLEEERRLAGSGQALVLRIYALSGRFMRDPSVFALGDFLLRAQRGLPIQITARAPVLRSYGHAGDIAAFAWAWLLSEDPHPFVQLNAVTHQTSIERLAQMVTSLFGLPPVVAQIDPAAPPHRYVAESGPFLAALKSFGQSACSLEDQILDTATGLGLETPRTGFGALP